MNNDLFDNPMVRAARKAMTPEQIEEYKLVGQYMYNNTEYLTSEMKASKVKEKNPTDLLTYATHMLNSGGDPKDLSPDELTMVMNTYGPKWYQHFDIDEKDVPLQARQKVTEADILNQIETELKNKKMSRQQRRLVERKLKKEKSKLQK